MLRNAVRVGVCQISRKKRYEGVRFNVIGVTVGVYFPGKRRYVTLEWALVQWN